MPDIKEICPSLVPVLPQIMEYIKKKHSSPSDLQLAEEKGDVLGLSKELGLPLAVVAHSVAASPQSDSPVCGHGPTKRPLQTNGGNHQHDSEPHDL